MNTVLKFLMMVGMSVVTTSIVHAECALVDHRVTGSVTSANQPIANATVQASWNEGRAEMLSSAATDATGQFELKIRFDSASGRSILGKEKCEGKLGVASVRVSKSGYKAKRVKVKFKQKDATLQVSLNPSN